MSNQDEFTSVEALLAHSEWVRSVARQLVRDPALADDVVQSSWVAALRNPPGRKGNLRGWWAKVVRNQARMIGRGEARRTQREQLVARTEAQPSLDDLAQRASMQREIVGHVLALEEPYRSVVLLRFFEDQTPPQIAARLNLPLKTVHSRLQRAFDRLRERLDGEYGSRSSWSAALLPLSKLGLPQVPAGTGGGLGPLAAIESTTLKGALLMNANTTIGVAAGALLLGVLGIWRFGSSADGRTATTPVELAPQALESAPERTAAVPAIEPRRAPAERQPAVAAPVAVASAASAATIPLRTVRGHAVNVRGAAIADVTIVATESEQVGECRTGPDGSFELQLRPAAGATLLAGGDPCLRVRDPAWVTLRQSCVMPTNREADHLIVAAPAKRIEGWVQDAAGVAVAGARLRLSAQGKALHGFPHAFDMTSFVAQKAESEANGRFEFSRFPDTPGLSLNVFAGDFVARTIDLDSADWPLVIELERTEESDTVMLEGTVFDQRGNTVEGAAIQLADGRAQSGPGGLFRMPLGYVAEGTPLCAAKSGFLPALLPRFGEQIKAQDGRPAPVELVLGGPPLEVRGRVLDAHGAPCARWTVSILDEVEVSQFRVPMDTAEALARGKSSQVRTDANGAFTLTGLFPREYRIQAYDQRTLQRTEGVVQAGEEQAVLRAKTVLMPSLSGDVVATDGQPLANVAVHLNLATQFGSVGFSSIQGAQTLTDDAGRFEFRDVPNAHVYLHLTGETIIPSNYEFPNGYELDAHRIVAKRRCHFRVELSGDYAQATVASFLDSEDRELQVSRFEARGMSGFPSAQLIGGQSEVLSVTEDATTLVLLQGQDELLRMPIQLDWEGVNVLRP